MPRSATQPRGWFLRHVADRHGEPRDLSRRARGSEAYETMRARFFILAISFGSSCAGLGVEACSGSSTDEASSNDAGGAEAAARDVLAYDQSEPPTCDVDADFTANVVDASLADGATTSGACVACMRTTCSEAVAACNKDCKCQNIAAGVLDCFVKSQLLSCSAPFYLGVIKQGLPSGKALLGCVTVDCANACGFSSSSGDGGIGDSSDGRLNVTCTKRRCRARTDRLRRRRATGTSRPEPSRRPCTDCLRREVRRSSSRKRRDRRRPSADHRAVRRVVVEDVHDLADGVADLAPFARRSIGVGEIARVAERGRFHALALGAGEVCAAVIGRIA